MSSQGCYPNKSPVVDSVLESLSNNIRREVIRYFEDSNNGDTAQLEELATSICNRVPSEDRKQLIQTLHHQHLPRLDKNDWLEYDTRHGDIRYRGNERAKPLIREVCAIF